MQNRISYIINYFSIQRLIYTELVYNNPYQLLISIVLSAQCLDKRVNTITPALFGIYPDFESLFQAQMSEVYNLIKSVSYPDIKSERIINISKVIHEQYNDTIPNSLELLTSIKGIGRKTANLVLAILYDRPGIAVDTHVTRVSRRIGLTKSNNPEVIEKDLYKIFPQKYWSKINPWFVIFGRYTCTSKKPKCIECPLKTICVNIINQKI